VLPTDSTERKAAPVFSGFMAYFPDAIAEVARLSKASNDKHNPGEPMFWSREKSDDHGDCLARHQLQWDELDVDSTGEFYHAVKVAWRAMAQLQVLLESQTATEERRWGTELARLQMEAIRGGGLPCPHDEWRPTDARGWECADCRQYMGSELPHNG